MNLSDLGRYNYILPPELVRKKPLEPRDRARLFVYDTKTDTIALDIFRNLDRYIPERSLVVLNDTRVLPVRLWLTKETGGKIEVFVLINIQKNKESVPVLLDRKAKIGQKLFFSNGDSLTIVDQQEEVFFVRVESGYSLEDLLTQFGHTPIPHYLEDRQTIDESVLRKRYQTIFAKNGASVAAPTAALHFTPEVFATLERKGIPTARITLDVGRGTFAPLTERNFLEQKLHEERVTVSPETAAQLTVAKKVGQPIVAVGTTVMRTLETIAKDGQFHTFAGSIDTFITPPHHFSACDGLITNFHLPKTSLMLLVDAFLQHKHSKRRIIELYEMAIKERFSFYSFGDSMFIL